jgi:hypothetical protein
MALRDFEEAIRLDPEYADAYTGRGLVRVRLGDCHGGVADAEEALRRGPVGSRLFYNAARIYAQALVRPTADSSSPHRSSAPTRPEYRDRSLLLLKRALELQHAGRRGAFWRDYVQADSAFAPLRHTPRYAQLANEYSKR